MVQNERNGKILGGAFSLFFAVLIGFGITGCKGKKSGQAVMQTPVNDPDSCAFFGATLRGEMGKHCCAKGEPLSSPPSDCPLPPGVAPITAAMQQYNDAAHSNLGSQQAADKLTSLAGAARGGAQPVTLAAQAGRTAAATGTLAGQPRTNTAQGGTTSSPSNGDSGSGSGNSGSAGSGGNGGGAGLGSVETSAASLENVATADATAGAAGKDPGAYTSGGAGMRRSGDGAFDEASTVNGARGNSTVTFRDPASENLSPMGTTEPENYFEMLHSTDSIFKVVEHRYVQKAMQWEVNRVKKATGGNPVR